MEQISKFVNLMENILPKKLKFLGVLIALVGLIIYKRDYFVSLIKEFPFSILAVALFCGIWILLKISDVKSNKVLDEARAKELQHISRESSSFQKIYFRLSEDFTDHFFLRLEMVNKGNKRIVDFDGICRIFAQGKDTWSKKLVDTKISLGGKGVENGLEYQIGNYHEDYSKGIRLRNWKRFEIIINNIVFEDNTRFSGIKLESKEFIRTYFFCLNFNRYYDTKIRYRKLVIPAHYNTVWLNEKIHRSVAIIKSLCSRRIFFFSPKEGLAKGEINELRKDKLQFLFFRTIFFISLSSFSLLIIISLYQFLQVLYTLFFVLGHYLWQKTQ